MNSRRFEFNTPIQDPSSLWNSRGVVSLPDLEVHIDRLACGDSVAPSPGVATYHVSTRRFSRKLYVETLKLLLRNNRSNLVNSQKTSWTCLTHRSLNSPILVKDPNHIIDSRGFEFLSNYIDRLVLSS